MTRSGGPLLSDGHGRIETAMLRKQDGLVTAGETSGSLDGPVKAIRDASPQARHHFTQADQVNLLVNASEADPDLGFMARMLVLCSLPRSMSEKGIPILIQSGPHRQGL